MKRLFTVKSTYTTVVLAENEEHAKDVWREFRQDITAEADESNGEQLESAIVVELPPHWEPDNLPWTDDHDAPDLTTAQIIANGNESP